MPARVRRWVIGVEGGGSSVVMVVVVSGGREERKAANSASAMASRDWGILSGSFTGVGLDDGSCGGREGDCDGWFSLGGFVGVEGEVVVD